MMGFFDKLNMLQLSYWKLEHILSVECQFSRDQARALDAIMTQVDQSTALNRPA